MDSGVYSSLGSSLGSTLGPGLGSALGMMPGVDVLGIYHLLRPIGTGGMARVWLGVDSRTGDKVAVKRMLPEIAADEQLRRAFIDEAQLGLRFSHPNIVDNIELGEVTTAAGPEPYLVLELLQGRSLMELMRAARHRRLVLPLGVAVRAVIDAARALSYAHKLTGTDGMPLGVVHRDVSPHNLFVCSNGRVKLVDFGIAKTRLQQTKTRTGTLKGKLAYLSPEQIRGAAADSRADVFALGIVLHEALTGRPLFRGPNDAATLHNVLALDIPAPETLRPSVPSGLGALVLRALHRDLDRRLPSAEAFADALEAVAESCSIEASAEEVRAFSTEIFPEDADAQEQDSALVRRTYEHLSSSSLQALGSDPWITPPQGVNEVRPGGSMHRLLRGLALGVGAVSITVAAAWLTATVLRARPHATSAAIAAKEEPTPAPAAELEHPSSRAAVVQPAAKLPPRAVATAVEPEAPATLVATHAHTSVPPAHVGTGRLRLAVNPWAEVSIDGKAVGTTPLRASDLGEGNHVVTLSNQELHVNLKRKVAVHSGKETVLVVDLFAESRRPH